MDGWMGVSMWEGGLGFGDDYGGVRGREGFDMGTVIPILIGWRKLVTIVEVFSMEALECAKVHL